MSSVFPALIFKHISRFDPNKKLVEAVSDNGGSLSYAAVTGIAKADDNNLFGIRRPTLQGLISHFYSVEHTREHSNKKNTWYNLVILFLFLFYFHV